MKSLRNLFALMTVILITTLCAIGQDTDHKKKSVEPQIQTPIEVKANVMVLDSKNELVNEIKPEDIKVFEDGVEQDISQFVGAEEPAVSVGVLDIRNSSVGEQIESQTFAQFLRNGSPDNEFWILRSAQTPGPTALLDGVRQGLTKLGSASNRRKILLIVSDGNEHSSPDAVQQAGMLARISDAPIYSISLTQPSPSPVSATGVLSDSAVLDILAEQSGGEHFVASDAKALEDVGTKIMVGSLNTYLLSYQPRNTSRDGKYRQIRVQILPPKGIQRLTGITRAGYYASLQEPNR